MAPHRLRRALGRILVLAVIALGPPLPAGCTAKPPSGFTRPPVPTGRLTVTVLDAAGQPAAGAGISLAAHQGGGVWGPPVRLVTDAGGRAEATALPAGSYQVSLSDALPLVTTLVEVPAQATATVTLSRVPPAAAPESP